MKKNLSAAFVLLFSCSLAFAQRDYTTSNKSEIVSAYYILEQLLNEPGIKNKNVKMLIVDFPPLSVSEPHRIPAPHSGMCLKAKLNLFLKKKNICIRKGILFTKPLTGFMQ